MSRSVQAIQAELDLWYAARMHMGKGGQSYTIKDRTLTRANLAEINDTIRGLELDLMRAQRGGGARMRAGVVAS